MPFGSWRPFRQVLAQQVALWWWVPSCHAMHGPALAPCLTLLPSPAVQLEKKQHLGEQEERRMRDKDAQHSQEMKDWRSSLSTRKKVSSRDS